MSQGNLIEIDGSVLEGGGQILRMSVTLSALCGMAIKIIKIRAGRSKPGLAAQHLKGIEIVRDMCEAKVKGAEIGSTEIEFIPHKIKGGEYTADPKTAGSISLLMQVAIPCALFADGDVTLQLKGGTNADMAPQVDYYTEVFRPNLEKFGGATFDFELHKRGYFPKGGGHVTVNVSPVRSLKPVNLTSIGNISKIIGYSFVAGTLPMKMSYEMADAAKERLVSDLNIRSPDIQCYKESQEMAPNNANGIILVCETTSGCVIGGSGLGNRGTPPSAVGRSAAQHIIDTVHPGACLDMYSQDQVILYMALAEGTSTIRVGEITMHTKTAIYIAEKLTEAKFSIVQEGHSNVITCQGIGYVNKYLPQVVRQDLR